MAIYKTNNPLIQKFDQQSREQKDQFIAGFIDGEGGFTVSFKKNKNRNSPKGYLYNIFVGFSVYQLNVYSNVEFLNYINDTIFNGVGRVRSESKAENKKTFRLDVNGYANLSKNVLPFLNKIVLISKQADYQRFFNVLEIIGQKQHTTREGFLKIVQIAYTMNLGGKNRIISQETMEKEINEQFDYSENK